MKILLKSRLLYYSAVVLTGRTCIETAPDQLQKNFTFSEMDSRQDCHKPGKESSVEGQDTSKLIDIIGTTTKVIRETAEMLRQYQKGRGHPNNTPPTDRHNQGDEGYASDDGYSDEKTPDSTPPTAHHNSCNGTRVIKYATERKISKEEVQEQVKKEIPNVRPTAERAAIQHVSLVSKDLREWADYVHKYIPAIEEVALIETLTLIQDRINMLVDRRKIDNDRILTDQQKDKLSILKFNLKQHSIPWVGVVYFYKNTYDAINESVNASQTIKKDYSTKRYKAAKAIRKRIEETVNETNALIDLMKIKRR